MKKLVRFMLAKVPRRYLQRFSHVGCRVIGFTYVGDKVECPVCGSRYRKFIPYGYVESRDNALCPRCLSLERHRLLWLYLQNETPFFDSPSRVLHVAPEYCFIKRFDKMPNLDYVTADLESPLAKVKMSVESIPFEDENFDVIFCNHVLEHVNDDILAMRELYRVMKKGGWGILLSPVNPARADTYEDTTIIDPIEREHHFGQKDHLREYGRDYAQRLACVGFDTEEIDYIKYLGSDIASRAALRSEVIYLVRKPL